MKLTPRITLILLSTLLSVGAAEIGLRLISRGPWHRFEALEHVPVMTDAHPTLGWTNRPGVHRYSLPGGEPVTVTLDDRGARVNGSTGGRNIWVYGGSFAMGFGLNDGLDFPAQLGQRLRDTTVRNAAVPGFGTVQSRALFVQHLRDDAVPDVVIYGLVDYHDARNAGTRAWLHALERAGGHHPWRGVPWAWWDGHDLHFYPPRTYQHWPASEWSALANLLELASIDVKDRFLRTKTETTVQTILRWRDDAEGARFVVALLYAPTRHRAYLRRLREEGIEVVDLRDSGYPAACIPIDGHPDASVHTSWASGLAKVLR